MLNPLITNDAVVLGILISILAFVFKTSNSESPFWKRFYSVIPSLLLCYFIPSIFNSLGIISGENSNLYFVSSRYLLPASLVLLTISIDLKEILRLGPKALIMFFTATFGIIVGGPLAILIVARISPDLVGGVGSDSVWRGLATIAGSWIGGGANQAAMKEIFSVSDILFSSMITVDVIVANIWMAFLLYGIGISPKIDKWLDSDNSSIEKLKQKMDNFRSGINRTPNLSDVFILLSVGFGVTGIAHQASDFIAPFIKSNYPFLEKFSLTSNFFWIIVLVTTIALLLSFTNLRNLEGVGASRYGSVFLYILVATIGMKMNIFSIFNNPSLFIIGIVWITIHATLMILVAKLIKAPFFFLAVGSQANIGGAASAPIIASAFHPSLAPVGVLLAVLGYAVGTYGAWLCGILMQSIVQ
tara:strand:+ start:638 stop:1882 length:1245 start_codon:yes stop_codon:yes gene_type:complete